MITFPYRTRVLQVVQPLGTFYVAVLPAELLLQVAASDVMSATLDPSGVGYVLNGTQRIVQDKRLRQIADYIDRIDSAFPNSIILAANYNRDVGIDQDEIEAIEEEEQPTSSSTAPAESPVSKAWTIVDKGDRDFELVIPSGEKLAAIIDGQHRLFAFARDVERQRLEMQLVCSIFLDLPKPFQAQLFATINSNQKAVDRSLTFELFGYNVAEEEDKYWTPDKLAVFLTRRLGTDEKSPLYRRITVAPKKDLALQQLMTQSAWKVSTAVVVDGILRLISTNPKRDANTMRTQKALPRTVLRDGPKDRAPLRYAFIDSNDTLIYRMVENYLDACKKLFFADAPADSFILRTVGIQALFDILRKLAPISVEAKDVRVDFFESKLRPATELNFSSAKFRVPAGSGRTAIRDAIERALQL